MDSFFFTSLLNNCYFPSGKKKTKESLENCKFCLDDYGVVSSGQRKYGTTGVNVGPGALRWESVLDQHQ